MRFIFFHITDQGRLHCTKHPNIFQGEQVTVATSQMRYFFTFGRGMHPSSTNGISWECHSIDANTKSLSLSMDPLKKKIDVESKWIHAKKNENYELEEM